MKTTAVVFSSTGKIQTYIVPASGTYLIEAAGGQGGASADAGHKGGVVSGMFFLHSGEALQIVAGRQGRPSSPPDQPEGQRGGASLVWIDQASPPYPLKLLLSARGGLASSAASDDLSEPPFSGRAPSSPGLTTGNTELDTATADALVTQWIQVTAPGLKSPTDPGRSDRAGFNTGGFRRSKPAAQAGDGYVCIAPVVVNNSAAPEPTP